MLPGIDGYQVCREIRKSNNVPIIMLSAKGETFDKVLGLELGLMIILSSLLKQRNWLPVSRRFYAAISCRRNLHRSVRPCSAWNTLI